MDVALVLPPDLYDDPKPLPPPACAALWTALWADGGATDAAETTGAGADRVGCLDGSNAAGRGLTTGAWVEPEPLATGAWVEPAPDAASGYVRYAATASRAVALRKLTVSSSRALGAHGSAASSASSLITASPCAAAPPRSTRSKSGTGETPTWSASEDRPREVETPVRYAIRRQEGKKIWEL